MINKIIETHILYEYIKKNKDFYDYVIFEKESYMLEFNKKIILQEINKKKKIPIINLILHKKIDWKNLFLINQNEDFFNKKKIIILSIYEKYFSNNLKKYLEFKKKKPNKNIINIFCFSLISNNIIYPKFFYLYFEKSGIIIKNSNKNNKNFKIYVEYKIKKFHIKITKKTIQYILKNSYQNIPNILKILDNIILLYPKSLITKSRIKKYYSEEIKNIKIYNLILEIINKKKKKIINILKIFQEKKYNLNKIFFSYKKFLYYLLMIKEKLYFKEPKKYFYIDNNKILFSIIKEFCKKLNLYNIYISIKILKNIEYSIKIKKSKHIWMQLESLSLLLI